VSDPPLILIGHEHQHRRLLHLRLAEGEFPNENHTFVKSFCDDIGIAGFEFVPADYRYIAATRRDGTGELRIHWG
jgi:hypothetical protein